MNIKYSNIDFIFKKSEKIYGEIFDITEKDFSIISIYMDCLIKYNNKKYIVKAKENFSSIERKNYIICEKQIIYKF